MISSAQVKVFAPLFLVIIIDTMGLGIVFPVLSPLVLESNSTLLSTSATLITREMLYAFIIGIFSLFLLIGAPLLGDLSDCIGRKKALLICLMGTGVSFVLCTLGVWAGSIWILLLGRAFNGFAAGSGSIAQAAIADISTPQNKAVNLGFITLANCIGFVVGPIVGGFFADHSFFHLGYGTPFAIAAFMTFLNILCLQYFMPRDTHPKRALQLKLSRGISIFIEAIRSKKLRYIALLFLCLQLGWSIYFQFIAILLVHQYHYTATGVGFFMAFVGLLFAFCLGVLIKFLLELATLARLIQIAFVIIASSLFAEAFISSEILQWVVVMPMTLSVGLSYTGILTLFSNAVDHTLQGWIMGVSAAVAAAAWMLGAGLAGLFSQCGIAAPFILASSIMSLGFLICFHPSLKKL